MKKRLLSIILTLALCLSLLPMSALAAGTVTKVKIDGVDANGNIVTGNAERGDTVLTADNTTLGDNKFYIVQENTTIDGNLTINSTGGGLILCQGATLTVEGALIFNGSSGFGIYGTSNNGASVGELIIENSKDDGAAIRTDNGTAPQLRLHSGKLTINDGNSKKLVEGVMLYSENKIHKGALNDTAVLPSAWSEVSSIEGTKLVLEYCGHDDADTIWIKDNNTQHHWQCKVCGFTSTAKEEHDFRPVEWSAETHTMKCDLCGYEAAPAQHNFKKLEKPAATSDGKGHTTQMCEDCGYTSGEAEAHNWNEYGACEVCDFRPILQGKTDNLYDDLTTALNEGETELTLVSKATDDTYKGIVRTSLEFNTDADITLNMGGCTLVGTGSALVISNGKLTVKGDATISGMGTGELASSAVRVTGGELIFDGKLTATGANGKYAVEVTGGTLTLKEGDVLNGGVSVEDSSTYNSVNELLGENLAFAKTDNANTIVPGNVQSISENVTVVAHTHGFALTNGNYTCTCGYTCPHNNFENGVCKICGNGCAHTDVNDQGVCQNCKAQMTAKIEVGGDITYSTDLAAALTTIGTETKTVTLLADGTLSDWAYICGEKGATNGPTVTLNLNEHSISSSMSIAVGKYSKWVDLNNNTEWETPAKLIITGKGNITRPSFYGSLLVEEQGTLELSGWESGTISCVSINKDESNEGTLIVGENIGTISRLEFSHGGKDTINNTKLNGGKYDEIWVLNGSAKLGELLAEGYAFQTPSGFEKYDRSVGNPGITEGYTVVKCPHSKVDFILDADGYIVQDDKAKGGVCAYCGKTGIAALVGSTIYDNVNTAVEDWLSGTVTGTLKLFTNVSNVNFANASGKTLAVDLNSCQINYNQAAINLNGVNLTIQDSKEKVSNNGTFGPIVADSGKLTLEEGGYLQGLKVSEGSTATVELKGGKVHALDCSKPVYTLLPDGYAMMNGNNTVPPTTILSGTSQTYDITNAKLTDITSEKIGETTFGSNTIPFALSLKTSDSKVGKMSFEWYRIDSTTGVAVKLAGFNQDETPVEGVYTFNPNRVTINAEGWSDMTPGEYNVICVVSGKEGGQYAAYKWQTALTGYKLTITPASIADAQITVDDKNLTYDGTAKSPTVTVSLNGETLGAEDYDISGNTAINAGEHILTITGKGNYKDTVQKNWNIAPKTVEDAAVEVTSGPFTYDGTEIKPTVTVKDGTTEIWAEEYTVSYENNINAGSATVKVTSKGDSNHTFNTSTTFTITQADAPTAEAGSLTIVNGLTHSYTLDLAELLPELPEGCEYGAVEYDRPANALGEGSFSSSVNSKTGELTLTATRNSNEPGQFGTITVPVKTTNYKDFNLTINVSAVNKLLPEGQPTLSKAELTYGDALSTIALSGALQDKTNNVEVPGTFAWADGTIVPDAGAYQAQWKFTPNDTETYQETSGTVTITVNKATPTGAPKYTAITTSGKKLSDAGLTTEGGTFSVPGTVQWELGADTEVKANTAYKWVFTPTDSNNYNSIEGSVTLYPVSSSGGSSRPSYSVNTPSKTENGSVSLSTKNASQGSTVTVTVQPDSGYVLEKLTVTDKNGKELTLTDQGDGKFTFVMPAGTVEIKASFTEEAKAPVFADVSEQDYYYEAVQWAQKQGITDGISADLFGPNQPCTRAQIVTFLWRAAGSPEPKGTSSFADVPAESYYAKAVAWAVENGITTGTASGTFAPDAPCDRAQSVTFLFRALGEKVESGANFSDVPAESYYADAVAWAAENGITTGTSSTTFSPNNTCTRGQIVTFLYRTYQGK